MALKETVKHMRDLLTNIVQDLEKADAGNKAASQRVRTGTVRLEKIAKSYRKESIKNEKQTKGTKKPAAKKASSSRASASSSKSHGAAASKGKSHASSASKKPQAKAKQAHKTARPHALSFKRPTAKLPFKRAAK